MCTVLPCNWPDLILDYKCLLNFVLLSLMLVMLECNITINISLCYYFVSLLSRLINNASLCSSGMGSQDAWSLKIGCHGSVGKLCTGGSSSFVFCFYMLFVLSCSSQAPASLIHCHV